MAAETRRPTVYVGRFALAYAVLGAAIAAAVVGLVIAVSHATGLGETAPWSTWQPTSGSGLGVAEQIASHVGGEYRLPTGGQLAAVIAKPPVVTASSRKIPLGYVAINSGSAHVADSVATVNGSNSVMFTLCGLGPSCSIASGKPSFARGLLERREILELALYTFHFDPNVHNVIAFMTPRAANVPGAVIFLQRADLANELSHRYAWTLDPQTPGVNSMTPGDKLYVNQITGHRAYSFSLTQAQDGNAALVLTHLKA